MYVIHEIHYRRTGIVCIMITNNLGHYRMYRVLNHNEIFETFLKNINFVEKELGEACREKFHFY